MIRTWQSIRSISISTSSSPITAINKTITTDENIQNVKKLANNEVIETPNLVPIDSTLLSVELPPSIPIYMKRGSLISIYGISNLTTASITNQLEFHNALKLLYGDFSLLYAKYISTAKLSMLLTSNKKNWFNLSKVTNNKSLSILNLDGSTDWALLHKGNLQFYIGDSLKIANHLLPRKISKKLSQLKQLPSSTRTGLPKFTNYSYNLLSGRGQLGLTGNGSIYNINLVDKEEILINKKNLLAITVNGPLDLQNCIIDYNSSSSGESDTKLVSPSGPKSYFSNYPKVNQYIDKTLQILGLLKFHTKNYLIGNQQFIKVIGPRNLLIQSDINFKVPQIPKEDLNKSLKSFNSKTKDFLNYVNVNNSKVKISSTDTFRDSLK